MQPCLEQVNCHQILGSCPSADTKQQRVAIKLPVRKQTFMDPCKEFVPVLSLVAENPVHHLVEQDDSRAILCKDESKVILLADVLNIILLIVASCPHTPPAKLGTGIL